MLDIIGQKENANHSEIPLHTQISKIKNKTIPIVCQDMKQQLFSHTDGELQSVTAT